MSPFFLDQDFSGLIVIFVKAVILSFFFFHLSVQHALTASEVFVHLRSSGRPKLQTAKDETTVCPFMTERPPPPHLEVQVFLSDNLLCKQ